MSMNRPRSTQPASDMEMLINERDRINHSHGIADSVLETAYATRNEFGRQRQTLTRINQRLMQSASIVIVQRQANDRSNTRYQYTYWENKYSEETGYCNHCCAIKFVYFRISDVSLNIGIRIIYRHCILG